MIKLYCVIQEVELRKENTYGAYKELEAYKVNFSMNGEDMSYYSHRYTGNRFERSIRKAYKMSIHKSYREHGKVKKKQWSICTASYYDLIEFSLYDYAASRIEKLSNELDIKEDVIYELIYLKLDPLVEKIKEEFYKTEEHTVKTVHELTIKEYLRKKEEFRNKYDSDSYDYYYDVFGVLREKEKFEAFKKQYEAAQEQQRSYYENYKSNYNSSSFGSYFNNKQSNYTDKEKEYLKKIYRTAAKALHPDVVKDDGEGMKFLNNLKESWEI
ncbi:hypothetical protein [Clostridium saccharoperbutylacetonicum]|uniref:hypothetical protein n=1 Tax=Clostridium saccharoperbutylacetonicum TaxID=36745 RepID=UPI0030FF3B89